MESINAAEIQENPGYSIFGYNQLTACCVIQKGIEELKKNL